jgi:hypothetical protein
VSASTLPKLVSIVLLAVLVAAALRAFLGAPPRRRMGLAPLAVAAALAYAGALVLGYAAHERAIAALVAACGVLLSCLAGYLARGEDRGGGSDPSDEPPDEPPAGPINWDEFERELRDYIAGREREPAGNR